MEENKVVLELSDKKILIVDDNKLNLKVAERLIQKYNPQIETVESGFECLKKILLPSSEDRRIFQLNHNIGQSQGVSSGFLFAER